MKLPTYVVQRTDGLTGSYTVYKMNGSCVEPYGTISAHASHAVLGWITPTDIGLDNSSCTIDPTKCRFDRGATAGTWSSQWYVIYPQFGPTGIGVRKYIRFRLKNMNGTVPVYDYNQAMKYDGTLNTWSVSGAVASGGYEVQVLNAPLTLCEIRG